MIDNKIYKNALVELILSMYQKFEPKQYQEIINCQFLLKDIDSMAKTMISIVVEETETLIAYQIALDLYDSQNNVLLQDLSTKITSLMETSQVNKENIEKLKSILEGKVQKSVEGLCLTTLNKANNKLFEDLKKGVEKCGSTPALGVIISHSLMYARTKDDETLKANIPWISKMTNWCRFAATASLGVIHMGNVEKGFDIIKPFLPGGNINPSVYAQSGAYYGIGLIYANTNNKDIVDKLNEALSSNSNHQEVMQHGILLALGLVTMGTGSEYAYTKLREFMYKDDAIIGEAATYAIGLSMLGTKHTNVVEDLFTYSHETQHEKIIRAISLSLGLVMYGAEEEADVLIEKMAKEKDPIIRYGAMFVIGLAYAGTGNSNAFKKLIKFSVSDVNDDVRRAALINVGFLHIKTPHIIIEKLKVMHLLSESYNQHVRYGTAMCLGIACAGSQNIEAYNIIEPLLNDPSPLVRQAAYIAGGMIFSQTNPKSDPKFDSFKENLVTINNNKEEHNLIKLGSLISQGILELGGKNCILSLVSQKGHNRVGAVIGMALFTQYYYWFPMAHFLTLAISPQIHMGIDETFQVVKNFKMISKAKPSLYGYPLETKQEDKKEKAIAPAAVLSSQTRMLAKKKSRLGTTSCLNTDLNIEIDKQISKIGDSKIVEDVKKNPETSDNNKMVVDDAAKEKEKPLEEKKEEPLEELLTNPCRILYKQKDVIEILPEQTFTQVTPIKYTGIIMLKKVFDFEETEYLKEKISPPGINNPKNPKLEENLKAPGGKETENKTKGDYKPVPTSDDVEMPEEFDESLLNKKKE